MHNPTLLTIAAVLIGTVTLVLGVVWHLNRHIPGLRHWLTTYAFGFLFCLIFVTRDQLPELLAVVTAQGSLLLMGYFNFQACCAYMGLRPPPHRYPAIAILATVALAAYFTAIEPNLAIRFLLISVGPGVFFLWGARQLLQGLRHTYPTRHLFAYLSAGHGLFLMLRPWLFKFSTHGTPSPTMTGAISQMVILESMIAMILMGFGVLMLANEYITHELRYLAEKDALTNVFNRRAFMVWLDKACSLAQRKGESLAVLLIDLDHFKHVNDTWGHPCGDEVLRHFATVATHCVRTEDVIGRLGGEEFAIVLPQTGAAQAYVLAERLRQTLASKPAMTDHGPIVVTASIGIASRTLGMSNEMLLQHADAAMYAAKMSGRNRVQAWSPAPPAVAPAPAPAQPCTDAPIA